MHASVGYPTDCPSGELFHLVFASQLTDLLLGVYDPSAVLYLGRMSPVPPNRHLSTASGGLACNRYPSPARVSRPAHPEWIPSEGGLQTDHSARLVEKNSEYSLYCPYSFVLFITLSISPYSPPPPVCSAGTQSWSRAPNCSGCAGENNHNNSSVRLNHLLTAPATITPLVHSHIYGTTQSVTNFHNRRTPKSGFGLRLWTPKSFQLHLFAQINCPI